MSRIFFNLTVHTELRNNPQNLDYLASACRTLYSRFGVRPTFAVQSEPDVCQPRTDLFKLQSRQVDVLSGFGEVGIHSHFLHDKSKRHQDLHIQNALESARVAGYHPSVWVSGDWIANEDTFELLEKHDVAIDSSVNPGFGSPPHSWLTPKFNYWPKRGSIHRTDSGDHYRVMEVPPTPRLRVTPNLALMFHATKRQVSPLNENPIIIPIHSYDFCEKETLWNLMGYLLWLHEQFEVQMATLSEISQLGSFGRRVFQWRDLVKDILMVTGLLEHIA